MATFGDTFRLTLLTNDAALAAAADRAGIDRIGVDLERLGKTQRQAGLDTRLSDHRVEELEGIGKSVKQAKLFARLNSLHPGSGGEVETALAYGAQVLMLPYFHSAAEVETFTGYVRGRASVVLLLETAPALVRIREILAVPGIDEVMIGLNDLRIELGVPSHFEVLASPLLDLVAREVQNAKLAFSVGGVGRTDDTSLPVPPDLVLAQFPRLNATGAWISRSFVRNMPPGWDMAGAVVAVRRRLDEWARAAPEALERARDELAARARQLRSSAG
jgi:hypothetical protein